MAVRIRLKRVGKIHAAQYRVVVVDSRKKRDGRVIEEVGYYDPQPNPSIIRIDSERASTGSVLALSLPTRSASCWS